MYATVARQHIIGSKIAAQQLDKLRPSHIEAWKVELEQRELSESTIRSAYTILRAVLDTAVRDRALAQNPAHAVRRPKVTAREAAYLAPDQVRSLPIAAKPGRYAPLFELLVNTGLRRGEALALHWSDIDLDAKLLGCAALSPAWPESRRNRNEDAEVSPSGSPLPHRGAAAAQRTRQSEGRAAESGLNVAANPVPVHNRAGRALRSSQCATCAEDVAKRAGLPSSVGLTAALCCLGDVSAGVPLKSGLGGLRSRERCDHRRHLRAR
jgi:Phage integrase family